MSVYVFLVQLTSRAAVLGKTNLSKQAVEDINIALKCGYPQELKFKAYQRLAVGFTAMKDTTRTIESYKFLLKSLDDSNLPVEKKNKMKSDCVHKIKQLSLNAVNTTKDTQNKQRGIFDVHKTFFSNKIKIESTEMRGRYSIAKELIPAGEIIANESSCLSSTIPSKRSNHCLNCSKYAFAPLPCPGCCYVCFCCSDCRAIGLPRHLKQCRLSNFLNNISENTKKTNFLLSPLLAALDLILQQDFKDQLEIFKSWKDEGDEATKIGDDKKSYFKVLKMVKHFSSMDIKLHFVNCVLVMKILKFLDYFPANLPIEDEQMLLVIVCHYFAAVKSNIHTTSEIRFQDKSLEFTPVGVGMYPEVALHVNHSCNPNTFTIDNGTNQLTVAGRDIVAGEEITHIYVGHYGDTTKEKRQELLQRKFHFQCCCLACEQDYPSAEECLNLYKTFAETPPEGLKKIISKDELDVLDKQNDILHSKVEIALQKGLVQTAINLTLERIKLISDNLKEPHVLYLMSRMSLVNYMWYIHGNKSRWFRPEILSTYF